MLLPSRELCARMRLEEMNFLLYLLHYKREKKESRRSTLAGYWSGTASANYARGNRRSHPRDPFPSVVRWWLHGKLFMFNNL